MWFRDLAHFELWGCGDSAWEIISIWVRGRRVHDYSVWCHDSGQVISLVQNWVSDIFLGDLYEFVILICLASFTSSSSIRRRRMWFKWEQVWRRSVLSRFKWRYKMRERYSNILYQGVLAPVKVLKMLRWNHKLLVMGAIFFMGGVVVLLVSFYFYDPDLDISFLFFGCEWYIFPIHFFFG